MRARSKLAATIAAIALACVAPALADEASDDPLRACDRAALRAEADWHLPPGVLSAIATVESGRGGLGSSRPVAWPWTINAGGQGLYKPNPDVALMTVRSLLAAGFRTIDVGCFQVDLYYHPNAFASLDTAFDPATNAQAAARILTDGRLASGSWEMAIAWYHSATPMLGAHYLRRVQAAWPWAKMRAAAAAEAGPAEFSTMLSPPDWLVRVISPTDQAEAAADTPRVLSPRDSSTVLQWTAAPAQNLPVILKPVPASRVRGRRIPD